MNDLIYREQAMDIFAVDLAEKDRQVSYQGFCIDAAMAICSLPSAEKKGHWENIDIIHDRKDAKITDWQQAQCSVCGKWHTTPYLYCINLDPYCPSCGAKMEE